MGEEEKGPCQRELSHCLATDLVPERHCGTTQHDRASGFHTEGSGGHPALQPPRYFPPQSLSPYFLCKLQVSLIMLCPGFNECLPLLRPSVLFIYLSMGKQLQQDKCDFYYMVVCAAISAAPLTFPATVAPWGESGWRCQNGFLLCFSSER